MVSIRKSFTRRLSINYIIVHAYYVSHMYYISFMSVRQVLYNFVFGVLTIVVQIFKGYIFILSGLILLC